MCVLDELINGNFDYTKQDDKATLLTKYQTRCNMVKLVVSKINSGIVI